MAGTHDSEAHFARALHGLTGEDPALLQIPAIGLAVSGGPDSLALLLLAHAVIPRAICAATVDHRLRPEAASEAAYVAQLCAERGIPHQTLIPHEPIAGNIQSSARQARYKLLDDWADARELRWIATAHHADDQLETLLMRIARGSGISGLAAIRARNGRIIRPLLGRAKADLVAICAAHGVAPCDDPSNSDLDFDRVKLRQWLKSAPQLLNPCRAARSAAALDEANAALDWMADRLEAERVASQDAQAFNLDPAGLPAELLRRLLLRTLARLDPMLEPRGDTIDRALAILPAGGKLTIGDIACAGGRVWHFAPAPRRQDRVRRPDF